MSISQPKSLTVNDNKAGMKNLDKSKINEIILEVSKGSKFYDNEVKKETIHNKQIDLMLSNLKNLTEDQLFNGINKADQLLNEIDEDRNFNFIIVHVDMDAFFAAAEIRDDPTLRNKPMAVGSLSMLSTSNYEARQFGVRAGMPGFIAKKLCPDLILIEPNFEKYTAINRLFQEIFLEYDANFSSFSLDEACLDITEHIKKRLDYLPEQMTYQTDKICKCSVPGVAGSRKTRLFKVCLVCGELIGNGLRTFEISPWSAVEELRFRIFCATDLTCSAGIAPNSLLAKIASDMKKPNGQYQVSSTEEDVRIFIEDLPVRKVPGIGKITERKLEALGISKCGDFYEKRGALYHLFKSSSFKYFMRIVLGEGEPELETDVEEKGSISDRKSMSVERTFCDCDDSSALLDKCKSLSRDLSCDLFKAQVMGKCISIKFKLSTFETRTRAMTISKYTNDVDIITRYTCELLNNELTNYMPAKLCLRLLGVRMSSLVQESLVVQDTQVDILEAFKIQKTTIDSQVKVNTLETNQNDSSALNTLSNSVKCPICLAETTLTQINQHLDACLVSQPYDMPSTSSTPFSLKRPAPKTNEVKSSKSIRGTLDQYFSRSPGQKFNQNESN